MGLQRLVLRGIQYHRRLHMGLAAGAFLACAVLTGSLLVGHSVNRTLYDIATSRLGGVVFALDWGARYFDAELGTALRSGLEARGENSPTVTVAAVLALRGVAEASTEATQPGDRINRAWVYGVDRDFGILAPPEGPLGQPGPAEAFINEAAARMLSLEPGDDLVLRIPKPSQIPLEAPLASRAERDTAVARVRVLQVLDEARGGRFSLAADQAMPANIFVDRNWLAELAGLGGKANLLLAGDGVTAEDLHHALAERWQPELAGYRWRSHPSGIVQLESDRLFIEDAVVRAAMQDSTASPHLTYLVNRISVGERSTPYSFVAAGAAPPDSPEGAVCINQWTADALNAVEGDTVRLSWAEPLPSGAFEERTAEAPIHKILSMDDVSVERDLAPRFPGLTEVNSCRDWDIGMPLDEEQLLDPANEDYWKTRGQTPKLVTTFETGQDWWGSVYGSVTAVRFSGGATDPGALSQSLKKALDPADIGLSFAPAREAALQSVAQAIDFGALFTGMSTFLIAAALLLLGLLYAHGLQTRTGEIGVVLASGWTKARLRAWLLLESIPGCLAGALTGAVAGAAYARLLLYGLQRFWPDAVAGTPVQFHAAPAVLAQGVGITIFCVLAVLSLCLLRAGSRPVRALLQGDGGASLAAYGRSDKAFLGALLLVLPLAAYATYMAFRGESRDPTGWFFASGAALLAVLLTAYGLVLGYWRRRLAPARLSLTGLLISQLARRRSRTLGVAAVTGCGVFTVLSVGSMQAVMGYRVDQRESGAGGFSVFATTVLPVRAEKRTLPGLDPDMVVPLRVRDGDDAGCLNLNRARAPRIYGVDPEALASRNAFAFPGEAEALWAQLKQPLEEGVFPALVGDSDTAMWGLQAMTDLRQGTEYAYNDDQGQSVRLRTVGKLPMRLSLFQGSLLISEDNFMRLFPNQGGYRAFLVETPDAAAAAALLNREYGRQGMEAMPSLERLRAFHAVERAYLAMFLVLGGLGLLLGAGGAAVIAWRTLAERRAEFALFAAVGFGAGTIRRMEIVETAALVAAGLCIGTFAAALATLPLLPGSHSPLNYANLSVLLAILLFVYLGSAFAVTSVFLRHIPLSALRKE